MKKIVFFLLFAGSIVVVSGCAIGNRHRYDDTIADVHIVSKLAVAVTAHDQREYVVSGNKNPDFVGIQRGGFGNPFDVTTASGRPLAEDMTETISNSLAQKGVKVIPVIVGYSDTYQAVIEKLKDAGGERLMIITLTEWKSDTYQNTALKYEVKAEVLDREGTVLGVKAISGNDNLGGSFLNPPGHAREAVPLAFKAKIETLLNSPEIETAFR